MQENSFTHITTGIAQVIEIEEKLLSSLPVEVITQRRNTQNRTIKQILGHLIDSASNNHQRMVRLQYSKDLLFFPDYTQDYDLWIALQDYQNTDWANLIQLWKCYWCDFTGVKVTLQEMIEGYLGHLHLHIKESHELID